MSEDSRASGGSAGASSERVYSMGDWKDKEDKREKGTPEEEREREEAKRKAREALRKKNLKKEMEEEVKKEEGVGATGKAPTPMEIIMPYVDSLLDLPSKSFELRHQFTTVEMDQMVKIPLRVNEGQVVVGVTPKAIPNEIMWHSKNTQGFTPVAPANAKMAYEFFEGASTALREDEIELVLEKSKPGYCWRRLPFDFEPMPTPVFDELFNRTDNGLALKQWLGSLFDPGASRQHYVWIWGTGGQGKGSISRFLFKLFGKAYASVVPPGEDNRFWTFNLIGKRLAVFNDCKDVNFPTSGLGKSLVGDDPIPVEQKGGAAFTTKMNCLLMYNSNDVPNLSSEVADTRRAILVHVDPKPEGTQALPTKVYDKMLWDEAPGFLWSCIEAYKACGGHFDIQGEGMDDLIHENEMPFENIFGKFFRFVGPKDFLLDEKGERLADKHQGFVSTTEFQTIMTLERINGRLKSMFVSWIMRTYGVPKFRGEVVKMDNVNKAGRHYKFLRLSELGAERVASDMKVKAF